MVVVENMTNARSDGVGGSVRLKALEHAALAVYAKTSALARERLCPGAVSQATQRIGNFAASTRRPIWTPAPVCGLSAKNYSFF